MPVPDLTHRCLTTWVRSPSFRFRFKSCAFGFSVNFSTYNLHFPANFVITISFEKLHSSKNNFPIFSPERANISRAEKYWPDFNILCKFQRGNGCLHQRASCRHLCRSTPRSSRRRGCSTGSPPSPWSPCQTSWRVIPGATTRRPTIGMRCLAG